MSYHPGGAPINISRRTRRNVGVTTVFYTPGSSVPQAAAPPPVLTASNPVAYRVPAALVPTLTAQPTPYDANAAPGQAVSTQPSPSSVSTLQNFLATQSALAQMTPSTAPESSGPPPALTGPVSNPDGSPAAAFPILPVAIALIVVVILLNS
jgi:hypothetical protein